VESQRGALALSRKSICGSVSLPLLGAPLVCWNIWTRTAARSEITSSGVMHNLARTGLILEIVWTVGRKFATTSAKSLSMLLSSGGGRMGRTIVCTGRSGTPMEGGITSGRLPRTPGPVCWNTVTVELMFAEIVIGMQISRYDRRL